VTVLKITCFFFAVGIVMAANKSLLQRPSLKEMTRANPFATQPTAARAGQKLFERECSSCHGHQAQGTGRAPALAPPVLDQIPPGAIFWVLRNGSLRRGMPSFSHLPEPQRWQIVTYLKLLR
jgi:mono/diheme cytochrome c family protein